MKKFILYSQNNINSISLYKDHFGDYLINKISIENALSMLSKNIYRKSLYNILVENIKEDFLLVNAASFDYLVFRDKFLIKNNPYIILDGILFIAKILNIKKIDIVLKNYYLEEKDILIKSIVEAEDEDFAREIEINIYTEDVYYKKYKVKINPFFLENKKYIFDLYTITQFAYLAHIESFKDHSNNIKGTYLLSISGDVNNSNLYEFEIGTSFENIINEVGAINRYSSIKCVFTNGFLNPPLKIDCLLKMKLDYEHFKSFENGGICFIRDDRCILRVVLKIIKFAKSISCDKCMPCHYGFDLCEHYLNKILLGKSNFDDYNNLEDAVNMIINGALCKYIKLISKCIYSTMYMFKDEFLYALENKVTLYSFINK